MASQQPIVGAWFEDLVEGQLFEVVAADERGGTVEVQYRGGEVGEFDMEAWAQLRLVSAEAPEDAGAGYELSREDDWDWDSDQPIVPESWSNPLASIEPESFTGFDDY